MSKKHCANCAHWGGKGSEDSMRVYIDTHTQRWGHAPEEDERWRWCARVWADRMDVADKNGSTMALSCADFTCEHHVVAPHQKSTPLMESGNDIQIQY